MPKILTIINKSPRHPFKTHADNGQGVPLCSQKLRGSFHRWSQGEGKVTCKMCLVKMQPKQQRETRSYITTKPKSGRPSTINNAIKRQFTLDGDQWEIFKGNNLKPQEALRQLMKNDNLKRKVQND